MRLFENSPSDIVSQVELRDVDSGNKVNERLRTDEAIESMSLKSTFYICFLTKCACFNCLFILYAKFFKIF